MMIWGSSVLSGSSVYIFFQIPYKMTQPLRYFASKKRTIAKARIKTRITATPEGLPIRGLTSRRRATIAPPWLLSVGRGSGKKLNNQASELNLYLQ